MGKNEDSFFLNYLPISNLVSLEKAELPPFGSALRGDWTALFRIRMLQLSISQRQNEQ
ncbi:MAG: hypothetical protein ACLUOI_40015 [Eisenbergiella sp.]